MLNEYQGKEKAGAEKRGDIRRKCFLSFSLAVPHYYNADLSIYLSLPLDICRLVDNLSAFVGRRAR